MFNFVSNTYHNHHLTIFSYIYAYIFTLIHAIQKERVLYTHTHIHIYIGHSVSQWISRSRWDSTCPCTSKLVPCMLCNSYRTWYRSLKYTRYFNRGIIQHSFPTQYGYFSIFNCCVCQV